MEIKEKIKKLLALSESPNEGEAKAAMLKAQDLLRKYKLSAGEISSECNEVKTLYHTSTVHKGKWKAQIAQTISENFGCVAFVVTVQGKKKVAFVGLSDEVEICYRVYDFAFNYVKAKVKEIQKDYKKDNLSINGIETNYAIGFSEGLYKQFAEQVESDATYALVTTIQPDVEKFIKATLNPSTEYYDTNSKACNIDTNLRFRGYLDGYLYDCKGDHLLEENYGTN